MVRVIYLVSKLVNLVQCLGKQQVCGLPRSDFPDNNLVFVQVTYSSVGGYETTSEEIVASKKQVPWVNQGLLNSQQGSGGFGKTRDVVDPVTEMIKKMHTEKRKPPPKKKKVVAPS